MEILCIVQWSRAWAYFLFWTLKKKIHGVKAAPRDDKEGDSDKTKGCLGQVFYISEQAQHGK
jgi:hypothetical protein